MISPTPSRSNAAKACRSKQVHECKDIAMAADVRSMKYITNGTISQFRIAFYLCQKESSRESIRNKMCSYNSSLSCKSKSFSHVKGFTRGLVLKQRYRNSLLLTLWIVSGFSPILFLSLLIAASGDRDSCLSNTTGVTTLPGVSRVTRP